jgi:hypothetical protein
MNCCSVRVSAAGISLAVRISTHSAAGREPNASSSSGISASAWSRRESQEPKRGSRARSSRPITLQSFIQNDWLPTARKNHSPSPPW